MSQKRVPQTFITRAMVNSLREMGNSGFCYECGGNQGHAANLHGAADILEAILDAHVPKGEP